MTEARADARLTGQRLLLVALHVTVGTWLVYAATAGGSLATGDAVAMFEQARSLIDRGDLAVPLEQSAEPSRGWDGRYYVPFGIGQSLYDVPWILATRLAMRIRGTPPSAGDRAAKPLIALANTIPAAVTVGAGLLLAYELSGSASGSVFAAVALAFGTLMWPYAKYGFNAPLAACLTTVGVFAHARQVRIESRRMLVLGGWALGGALLTRHELVLAAGACLFWLAWQGRKRRGHSEGLLAASAGVIASVVIWAALNVARFHRPFYSGHTPQFSWAGVEGFALSPSGAVGVYAPIGLAGIGLVALARGRNAVAQLLLLIAIVVGGFYCALDDWAGTRSYGPRYLVTLMPLLVAPLAVAWARGSRTGRRWLVGAVVISAFVQLPPVLVNFSTAGIEAGQPPQTVRKLEWQWAPIVTTTAAAAHKVVPNVCTLIGMCARPAMESADGRPLADRLAFSLDFWWLYAFYLGALPRAAALLILPVFCGPAIFLFRHAFARARRLDRQPAAGVSP